MNRRLAAIVMADVVGFSRLMHADEAGTLAALKERRRLVVEPLVRQHGGRIVKVLGDGVLIEVKSAVNAVALALDLQRRMAELNEPLPESRRILLRIGINLGDVIGEGSDIYGDGVNIAARLEALAEPGGICVSGKVHEEVRGKVALAAEDLGEQQLKNIDRPIRVWRLQPGSAIEASHTEPQTTPLSIAVLPFDNMSGVPEQEYISDGISENIITDLSRFRDLTVIARNSSFAYKGKATRVQDIRRDLGVEYVLEGSVQRSGNRIRVTAQLIEAASGKHAWANRYDRDADDLFAVMDSVTSEIVGTLATTYGGRLRRAVRERRIGGAPTSFQALDHFVQGMEELNKFTKEPICRSILHFEKAIELSPRYAKAHAKLAWAHIMEITLGFSTDVEASLGRARAAAEMAVQSDDAEAWAHWARAGCAWAEGNLELATSVFQKAVELNSNDADILTDFALCNACAGRADIGVRLALRAMQLNPHHPAYYADQLGTIYFLACRYSDAVRTIEAIRGHSTITMWTYLAASNAELNRGDAAKAALHRLLDLDPNATVSRCTGPDMAPFRDQGDRFRLAEALRKAGLPE